MNLIKPITIALLLALAIPATVLANHPRNTNPVLEVHVPLGARAITVTFPDHTVTVAITDTMSVTVESKNGRSTQATGLRVQDTLIFFHGVNVRIVLHGTDPVDSTRAEAPRQYLPGIIHGDDDLVRQMQACALEEDGFSEEAILEATGGVSCPD